MEYLVDTNVFFHVINNNIYETASYCKSIGNSLNITNTILRELEPGYYKDKDSAIEILNSVSRLSQPPFKTINILDFESDSKAQSILKKIRERYYGWMKNPSYLKRLIEDGVLNKTDLKSLKKKDLGECELLALAKSSKGHFEIVTNDKGRVYKHPDINIYEMFKGDEEVIIHNGYEWYNEIKEINNREAAATVNLDDSETL